MVTSKFAGLLVCFSAIGLAAASSKAPAKKPAPSAASKKSAASVPAKKPAVSSSRKPAARTNTTYRRRHRDPWTEPTFADSTVGDRIYGEDLVVRRAAVEALGPYNGSVIVTDAATGRILTIVNQKLAFQSGFTPCSTIKLVTSVAGLVEGLITPDTELRVSRHERMNLTSALARSNNPYFQVVGRELGFERVAYYARMMGLGEKAGLNIPEEQPGKLPDSDPRASGGVGLMCSHGVGVELTPIQLSAMLAMIANNGILPWLQYPRSAAEVETFVPQMKRQVDLGPIVEMLRPGMEGAVEWGSGQRARKFAESDEPIFGKTGTCTHSDQRTHLGWFGSFNQVGDRKLVVVVLLTGGRPVNGPVASGIAGAVYKILNGQNYYAKAEPALPEVLRASPSETQ